MISRLGSPRALSFPRDSGVPNPYLGYVLHWIGHKNNANVDVVRRGASISSFVDIVRQLFHCLSHHIIQNRTSLVANLQQSASHLLIHLLAQVLVARQRDVEYQSKHVCQRTGLRVRALHLPDCLACLALMNEWPL